MESELTTSERMLLEAEFRERRRRVLRAEAGVVAAAVLGILGVVVAKQTAPAAFEAATAVFVLSVLGSLLWVWRTANRYWHCPGCEVRWETRDTLASFQWNHCTHCGTPLRTYPSQREQERAAFTEFALEALPHEEWVARFERRRRRSLIAAGAAAVLGIGLLVFVGSLELGEFAGQGVAAFFTAVVVGTTLWGSRCPRCRTGIISRESHCQRCGLSLGEEISEPSGPRTEA